MQLDTCQVQADTIWSKLGANHCHYVIAQPCSVETAHKGQIKGEAKAIRDAVRTTKSHRKPSFTRKFDILVESGMMWKKQHEEAVDSYKWSNCQQRQSVCCMASDTAKPCASHCPELPTFRLQGIRGMLRPTRIFFSTSTDAVRGHGAQVIIEGREIQSDGGEKNKDNPTTKKQPPTTAQRRSLHHPVVFPLC